MSITTTQYEKISRFLDEDMDMCELEEFEAELITNPEMREQLDFELFIRNGFASATTVKANNGFTSSADKELAAFQKRTSTSNTTFLKKWVATGVAASIIAAVALLLNQPSKKITPVASGTSKDTGLKKQDLPPNITATPFKGNIKTTNHLSLFKKYYSKDKLPDTYPIFLADAFTRYEVGNYSSLQLLDLSAIPETRSSNDLENKEKILQLAHYYKGISYLETGDAAKANIHFNWVLNNKPDKALLTKSEWYLALTCLKQQELGKTKDLLKKMLGNRQENEYSKQAKTLLDSLEK